MSFYVELKNRGLLTLTGPDTKDFLQGLVTNDIGRLTPQTLLYACLLTPQGKFLHDFFVREKDGAIMLDCEGGARAQDLAKRLGMYKLRKDVAIAVREENTVYAILSSRAQPRDLSSPTGIDPSTAELRSSAQDDILFDDPRHPALGLRSFTRPENLPEAPFEEWDRRRITLTIPDGSRDLEVGVSTMDEARMDSLNAIDYQKGCYIGQELTARMHYRGLGKKHLRMVKLDALPEKAELRSTCGDIGLALVRD